MFDEPPLKNRPTWKADTMVLPEEKVSGSTSVACWLVLFVYGSELIWRSVVLAWAGGANHRVTTATVAATASTRERLMRPPRASAAGPRRPHLCGFSSR